MFWDDNKSNITWLRKDLDELKRTLQYEVKYGYTKGGHEYIELSSTKYDKEIEKLKAIVAELCDYVYREQK